MKQTSSRSGTSSVGTHSPNTGGYANTNSTYGIGAFPSGITQATASYVLQNTDYQGIIQFNTASPISVVLNSSVQTNFTCDIMNVGVGVFTFTTSDGSPINQGGSTLVLQANQGATVYFANRSWTVYVGSSIIPVVPLPGTATPLPDSGAGAPGTSALYSRQDHAHPARIVGLPAYANNAAAIAGGLTANALYRTGGDPDLVCVVH